MLVSHPIELSSRGYAGASIKSFNDAPWEMLSLRPSRPLSAPLLTAVQGTCGVPAPLLTAVQGTCGVPAPLLTAVHGTFGVPAPLLTAVQGTCGVPATLLTAGQDTYPTGHLRGTCTTPDSFPDKQRYEKGEG